MSWIAEAQKHMLGAPSVSSAELVEGLDEGVEPKVGFALGPIQAVEEGSQVGELPAGVQEVEIQ